MTATAVTLFPGAAQWHLGLWADGKASLQPVELPQDATAEKIAELVAAALQAAGCADQEVVLAVPGTWCLAGSLALGGHRLPKRDVLCLRLEELLPISAEEFVADFVRLDGTALGIAGRVDLLTPPITALEAAGIRIAHACPAALLALRSILPELPQGQTCVLWQDGDQMNTMRLSQGTLTAWALVPAEPNALIAEIRRQHMTSPIAAIWCHGTDALVQAAGNAIGGVSAVRLDRGLLPSAVQASSRILAGGDRPIVELRRGALAPPDPLRGLRSRVNAALLAAVIFFCVAGLTMVARGMRYEHVAAESEAQEATLFSQAFPGAAAPVNVKDRLEAEYRSISGSTVSLDRPRQPVVLSLRDALGHIPPSLKFGLDRVDATGGRFHLEGVAGGMGDANALAAAIAAASSAKVQVPTLQQQPDGTCTLVIEGSTAASASPTTAPVAQGAP